MIRKSGPHWRPELEELDVEALRDLATQVGAECRRRALVLDEHLDQRLRDYEFALYQREDAARSMVQKEHDAQEAERLMLLWAERADSLNHGHPAIPAPRPLGPMVDELLGAISALPESRAVQYMGDSQRQGLVYAIANAKSAAARVVAKRKAPVETTEAEREPESSDYEDAEDGPFATA